MRRSYMEACEVMQLVPNEHLEMVFLEKLDDKSLHHHAAQLLSASIAAITAAGEASDDESLMMHLYYKLNSLAKLYAGLSGTELAIYQNAIKGLQNLRGIHSEAKVRHNIQ